VVEIIENNGLQLAIIIRSNYSKDGIEFFTPPEYSQQLAFMKHPSGKSIDAHIHKIVNREVSMTQEVLVIKKGIIRVDFYDLEKKYLESRVISTGDVILLAAGGHGFFVVEEVEMIEIKQGPYLDNGDKERFIKVDDEKVCIVGGGILHE